MSLQATLFSINTGGFPKSLGDDKVFSSLRCRVFRCHCLQMLLSNCHCLNGAPASPLEVQQLPTLFPEACSYAVIKETAGSIQSSLLLVFLKQAGGCGPLTLPSFSGTLQSTPQWGVSGPPQTHPHSPPSLIFSIHPTTHTCTMLFHSPHLAHTVGDLNLGRQRDSISHFTCWLWNGDTSRTLCKALTSYTRQK